jgi:hypothetical protein
MPQSLTSAAIAQTSKAAHKLLVSEGFGRKAAHLLRRSSDVLHCVHFQSSRWGTADDGQFTVNFVVTWPAIYEAWIGRPLPTNPATASFPIQTRIGSCLPARADVWWKVTAQTDPLAIASEVGNAIAQTALPFFARFPTSESVLLELRHTGSLPGLTDLQSGVVHAFLAHRAGNLAEATDAIAKVWSKAGNSLFRAAVRTFAQRTNIALPA